MNKFVINSMQVKDMIQIYHWQTDDYARHQAAGKLYDSLNLNLDKMVEVYQKNKRLNFKNKTLKLKNMSSKSAEKLLQEYSDYLTNIKIFKSPDLLNIRDEILVDVNQTLYLFSLN